MMRADNPTFKKSDRNKNETIQIRNHIFSMIETKAYLVLSSQSSPSMGIIAVLAILQKNFQRKARSSGNVEISNATTEIISTEHISDTFATIKFHKRYPNRPIMESTKNIIMGMFDADRLNENTDDDSTETTLSDNETDNQEYTRDQLSA